jgi:hypothetical protein
VPDIVADYLTTQTLHYALWAFLAILSAVFLWMFFIQFFRLKGRLNRFLAAVRKLKKSTGAPLELSIGDPRLGHLWTQYANTLHLPSGAIDPATGMARPASYRATVPAEAIFTAQSVYEGRIHTEFFKHLPGLLTGLGIIGTFVGLIDGLGKAIGSDGGLDTKVLIGSVKEAFLFSGTAIAIAMIVTFFEKLIVAGLHSTVEDVCQAIDELYVGGAGEEYLSRLVIASENSADHAAILKDELVERLGTILSDLAAKQIAASAQQQAQLQQSIVAAIDNGLSQPLGQLAQGFGQMRNDQGDQLSRSLQDSMAAFADRLNEILGGQVGQAKELQTQTLQALQQAIGAFQAMAQQVGAAGDNATAAMTSRLTSALDEMASRQAQMGDHMRTLVDEMRGSAAQAHTESSNQTQQLLAQLGQQVHSVSQALQQDVATTRALQHDAANALASTSRQATAELFEGVRAQTQALTATVTSSLSEISGRQIEMATTLRSVVDDMKSGAAQAQAQTAASTGNLISQLGHQVQSVAETLQSEAATARVQQQAQLAETAAQTRQATEELVAGVRAQTIAIEQASAAMRNAVGDLGAAVSRNVEQVGQGAARIEQAADRFTSAGRVVADVLEQSKSVTTSLATAANTLASSSTQVHAVLADYRDARDRFASLVSSLEKTIDTASRDAAMTSELVSSLQRAAEVMKSAQTNSEAHVKKVNETLEAVHTSFAKGMAETVLRIGTDANTNLRQATTILAATIHDFDSAMTDGRQSRQRA